MLKLVEEVFSRIPAREILNIAEEVGSTLKADPSLVQLKDKQELVTKADYQIQKSLLDYFEKSELAGCYFLRAEEEFAAERQLQDFSHCRFQLLIDPLDGTKAFCEGSSCWGSMLGVCELSGRLRYSWNLISSGQIFTSAVQKSSKPLPAWREIVQSTGSLKIDFYDYGAGGEDCFRNTFSAALLLRALRTRIDVSSYAAAVWAGWSLYNFELDGLLWLASAEGKGSYPDYDLIFLGAVEARGWKVALGKKGSAILMVAVAPTEEDLQVLWESGVVILGAEAAAGLTCNRTLCIAAKVGRFNLNRDV